METVGRTGEMKSAKKSWGAASAGMAKRRAVAVAVKTFRILGTGQLVSDVWIVDRVRGEASWRRVWRPETGDRRLATGMR